MSAGPRAGARGGAAAGGRPAPRHLYVHVPFCRARCDYCDFYSLAVGGGAGGTLSLATPAERLLDAYVDAVHAEWACERERFGVGRLESVHLGGGTPSLLGEERLERLCANPEDVTAAYACWAAARRVRISLGVQSFAARLRETLGRRATADPMAAAMRVREAGLEDLSIDLIFGIPGQTRADLEDDVAAVASLGPDHVSWYELEVVPGRLLAVRMTSQGGMAPGDDDVGGGRERGLPQDRDDYRFIVSALESLGYRWYETSNFALPRQRSRHNAAGWRGRDYLGLGPAAVSTVGDDRWRNVDDVAAYVAFWGGSGADAPDPPPRTHEHLDPVTRARERLMLAGRTGAAVPLAELDAALDRDAAAVLAAAGFVSLRGGTLRLTRKGRHVANDVCVRLFRVVSF